MVEYLERLDIPTTVKEDEIICEIPSFRRDLSIEADLIEEVGRFYGLNNIKPTDIYSTMTRGGKPYFRNIQSKTKSMLKSMGYNEILTYSFILPDLFNVEHTKGSKLPDSIRANQSSDLK